MIALLVLVACQQPATLTDVQQDVFSRSCAFSTCHGSAAAGDLDLTEGNSFASLVGVAAAGIDSTRGDVPKGVDVSDEVRVIPGDPDNSYLVKKLEGASDINGARMPGDAPALDPALIDEVRSWIADGAQDD